MYQIAPIFPEKTKSFKKPMSVDFQVAYYISVEGIIGKLQVFLVFLEHQFQL